MRAILQHDERDCGAACLAMIAKCYGITVTLAQCRELTKTDRMGTNLYGLLDGAEKMGLRGQALEGDWEELLDNIMENKIPFPFIAHFILENEGFHFVVVEKMSKNRFVILDPDKGKYKLDKKVFARKWTGHIAVFTKCSDSFSNNQSRKKGGYGQLLKKQYLKLFIVFILSFLIAVIGILGAFVFKVVLDGAAGANPDGQTLIWKNYNTVFVAIICLYILQMCAHFIRGKLIIEVGKNIDTKLMLSYYYHIMKLPVSSVLLRQTGEYLSRFSDAGIIRDIISTTSVTVILDATMAVGCGFILFHENNKLFLLAIGMLLIYLCIVFLYKKPIKILNQIVMEKNAGLQSLYKECIDGIETIKAAGAQEKICKKVKDKFISYINSTVDVETVQLLQETLIGAVELIGTTLILWNGFSQVNKESITIGSLITCYALLGYLVEPIKNLIGLQPQLQSATIAGDRLRDIFELQKEEDIASSRQGMAYDDWILDNVCFRYGNRRLILDHINIFVKRGEKIAIVGESGGGKTTIAKLLLKLYLAEDGRVLVDSIPVQNIPTAEIRSRVAYVDQNTFLFSDSILNNIRLGNQDATEEDIVKLCKACHIDQDIKKLPHGYHTILNENGSDLSGGQRQRIAIVRAFLKNPDLIIFDEATSNLDNETEMAIQQLIASKGKNIACIIIAHRLSTIKKCDRIYVIDGGKVIEAGSHTELLGRKGKYYQYWNE